MKQYVYNQNVSLYFEIEPDDLEPIVAEIKIIGMESICKAMSS